MKLVEDAVAAFVVNDDTRRGYLSRAGYVDDLFKSLLPDIAANEFGPMCKVFRVGGRRDGRADGYCGEQVSRARR